MPSPCKHFLTSSVKVISHQLDYFMPIEVLTFCSWLRWNCTLCLALSSLSMMNILETCSCSLCSWLWVLYWCAICHRQIWTLLGSRFLPSWLFHVSKLVSTLLWCKETDLNDGLEFFKLSCQQFRLYYKLVRPIFNTSLWLAVVGGNKD